MYKTHHVRTTFGSCDVEKVHAVVARSKFPSQNAQNTPGSDHFWKLRWWKSARRCGAKHISKSKCTKHTTFGPLLEVVMSKKCTPLWREAQFEVKSEKKLTGSEHFWTFRCRFTWQAQGIMHLVKSEQNVRVLRHFLKRWQAWDICRGSGKMSFAWQAQYKRHVHQSCSEVRALISWEGLHFGASDLQFWENDFAWQVQHFVWPGFTFSWQAPYFRQVEWKNRKTHWYEAVSSALNFRFLKDVSQNCFVFDVVKFESWGWGSLADCFVFDVVKFKNWGSLAE